MSFHIDQTEGQRELDRLLAVHASSTAVDPAQRLLIRGGAVLSMDDTVGDFAAGDVLIVGDRIAEVGANLTATDAVVIDATHRIIMPGFCDPHIHCWEGVLGRIIPENVPQTTNDPIGDAPSSSRSYMYAAHRLFAPACRPEDIYAGTLLSLLNALEGGITTVIDNMHNARSPEHSDAAVEALFAAGGRGIHAVGAPRSGAWSEQHPSDVARLREKYFASEDPMYGLRLFAVGFDGFDAELAEVRKDLDLWVTFDSGLENHPLETYYERGWLDGRETINHANFFTRDQRQVIIDSGAQVDVCPRIETQFRFGQIPYTEWVQQGLRPGISNDNPMTYNIDMFSEMRALYLAQRIDEHRGGARSASLRDILYSATQQGADNCGLGAVVGSLTPGKKADIVLLNTGGLQLYPPSNVISSVVQGAGIGSVDTVLVNGRVRKWNGELHGVDVKRVRQTVAESREYLLSTTDWPHDDIDFED